MSKDKIVEELFEASQAIGQSYDEAYEYRREDSMSKQDETKFISQDEFDELMTRAKSSPNLVKTEAELKAIEKSLDAVFGKNRTTTTTTYKVGTKFDAGKIPLNLLPTPAIEEIAKVLEFGAKKYDAYNWAKGMAWSRLIASALRHLFAWSRGEDKDPETGLSHLAHVGCCVLFLLQYELSSLGTDDRYKEFVKK